MEEHQQELTALEALDNGKSFTWAMDVDTTFAIDTIRYYAGWLTRSMVKWWSSLRPHVHIQIALATGSCIVMKPSESTPLPAIHMSKLIHEARFPPRTFNFLTGYGDIVGAAISSHMKIDKIAFTGSTLVGRKIMEVTAKSNLKDITLEVGGKSRNITFNDADVDQVASSSSQTLHTLIGDALDDVGGVSTARSPTHKSSNSAQGHAYASPPPSLLISSYFQSQPSSQDRSTMPLSTLDFPPLDLPFDPNSSSDNFTSHPAVISAVNRIVAAAGQMSATVQILFLTFCDAGMVEILREASPDGLHVEIIAEKNGVDKNKLIVHMCIIVNAPSDCK
ncbi:Aldehyde/histidinol dehydrogenase [Lentinula edodes]|nr:Aldehyde/histidinol dehydrogenase [Lentinula edodes]